MSLFCLRCGTTLVETDDDMNDYELEGKQSRHTAKRCAKRCAEAEVKTEAVEWWCGTSTTDEHVEHMVSALRTSRPAPGVDRIVLKDAAAMLFVLHREVVRLRELVERMKLCTRCGAPESAREP